MFGIGIAVGIGSIKPVYIRQEHQEVCFQERSHLSRQGIIVSHLNLLNGNGIIFVDNRNSTLFQQDLQGLRGILITSGIRKIILGQQNLSRYDAVLH